MKIPFHKTHITQDEITAVTDTMASGWLTMGPKTKAFEEAFADYVGADYAVSVNSATAGLHLALKAIGLQAGDEVIIPTHTFVSTAEVITYFNAVPVLCDSEESTHNMNAALIPSLITPKTKAIIPVHFSGIPCDMDAVMAVARQSNLIVIEDAAHALPSTYNHKRVGSIGDITCFSFYATKTLTTGEGGMITTHNKQWADHMAVNRLHGMSRDAWKRYSEKGAWHYDVIDNGYKYNMTDISASIGLVQLQKVGWMCEQRTKIADRYHESFRDTPLVLPDVPVYAETSWHLYVIKTDDRDDMIQYLDRHGIGTSVHFIPIHHHRYYQQTYQYHHVDYPVADHVFDRSLSLPIYPDMTDEQITYICDTVHDYISR